MHRNVFATLIACLYLAGPIISEAREKGPETLGLDVASHIVAPAVKQTKVNGQVWVDRSLRGRMQVGEVVYNNDDLLELELTWLDLQSGTAWRATVGIHAADLPTFGGKGDHAALNVLLGPGADVTITSASAAEMEMIGDRDEQALASTTHERITLVETCAEPLPADDPAIAYLQAGYDEPGRSRSMEARDRALSRGEAAHSRCERKN